MLKNVNRKRCASIRVSAWTPDGRFIMSAHENYKPSAAANGYYSADLVPYVKECSKIRMKREPGTRKAVIRVEIFKKLRAGR